MNGIEQVGKRLELFLLKKKDAVILNEASFIVELRGFSGAGLVEERWGVEAF